jgi:hypothetical protein
VAGLFVIYLPDESVWKQLLISIRQVESFPVNMVNIHQSTTSISAPATTFFGGRLQNIQRKLCKPHVELSPKCRLSPDLRQSLHFGWTGAGQLHTVRKYRAVQLKSKIQTHWNLIDRSMTSPPPLLSPSNILPPPSSSCPFILAIKRISQIIFESSFFKLRNSEVSYHEIAVDDECLSCRPSCQDSLRRIMEGLRIVGFQ